MDAVQIDTTLTTEQVAGLTSQKRLQIVAALQSKVVKGTKLTPDEQRLAARLLRCERGARISQSGSKKKAAAAPAAFDITSFAKAALAEENGDAKKES